MDTDTEQSTEGGIGYGLDETGHREPADCSAWDGRNEYSSDDLQGSDQSGTAGSSGAGTGLNGGHGDVAGGTLSAVLSRLTLHPGLTQGTHVINVGGYVENLGDRPFGEGEVSLLIGADPFNTDTGSADDNAEQSAAVLLWVPALPATGMFPFQLPLQVDPGHWHVTATLHSKLDGSHLATAEGDTIVQGHHAHHMNNDEHTKSDLGVVVTHLTRVDASLYQVHFVVTNLGDDPVPAGLPVGGRLASEASGMFATQRYDLPAPLAAGANVQTYLTLEGAAIGALHAAIQVGLVGPTTQDMLSVQAEDVHGG